MPNIPYPSVPNYAGVPQIPRAAPGPPAISFSIAPAPEWVNQGTGELPWGIFDLANSPIYTPTEGGTLSVLSFGFTRSMEVSDFPIEAKTTTQGAQFASFNKVYRPSSPTVTLALSGTEGEKIAFLDAIDAACGSTQLWNVYTPDASYSQTGGGPCTVERYSYQRTATRGATMLMVEVSLKQVMEVTASLGNTLIRSPQSPSASAPVNNGNAQASSNQILNSSNMASIVGMP